MRPALAIILASMFLGCGQQGAAGSAGSSGSTGHGTFTTQTGSSSGSSGTASSSTGSSGSTGSIGSNGSTGSNGSSGASNDLDQDGLDDAWETQIATEYLPYISLDPGEQCGTPDGFVVRVSPHPGDPSRPPRYLEIRYDHLYQTDCGTSGHIGDDENIAITVDTSLPAPQGIMMIKAIAHRNTACEHDSECVQRSWSQSPCNGYATCDPGPVGATRSGYPVVYVSQNKHGDYATMNGCTFGCDFGACTLATQPDLPAILNVGEPGHPLVSNLTTQGFVNADAGWTETQLYNYDPWGSATFGGAGTVSADLTDSALDTSICQ
jgi:hypothetical protein